MEQLGWIDERVVHLIVNFSNCSTKNYSYFVSKCETKLGAECRYSRVSQYRSAILDNPYKQGNHSGDKYISFLEVMSISSLF